MRALDELTPEMLMRFTQIDYDREMAFVAIFMQHDQAVEIGVARYSLQPDGESAEFAVVVSEAWQGCGLGSLLLEAVMDAARQRGVRVLMGEVLPHNSGMLKLAERMGFERLPSTIDDDVVHVTIKL
jgi:acetyltransferase